MRTLRPHRWILLTSILGCAPYLRLCVRLRKRVVEPGHRTEVTPPHPCIQPSSVRGSVLVCHLKYYGIQWLLRKHWFCGLGKWGLKAPTTKKRMPENQLARISTWPGLRWQSQLSLAQVGHDLLRWAAAGPQVLPVSGWKPGAAQPHSSFRRAEEVPCFRAPQAPAAWRSYKRKPMYSIYKPLGTVELEALLEALINIEILTSKF